jgi:hypothetical protein
MKSIDGTLMKLRGVVEDCLAKHLNSSAVFFADKLVSMSGGDRDDVFLYAQALYVGRHYRRALTVMRREGLIGGRVGASYIISDRYAHTLCGGSIAAAVGFRSLATSRRHSTPVLSPSGVAQ